MKSYACTKCGSTDVFIDDRGTQKALICGDCGAWLKWIGKAELPLVKRYIVVKKKKKKNVLSSLWRYATTCKGEVWRRYRYQRSYLCHL